MKKIRLAALISALLMILMTFVGCNALDAAKQRHAFYTEDGNILYDGEEYILFEYDGTMSPVVSSSTQYINVTEPDVPVLLSSIIGDRYDCSDDKIFLIGASFSGFVGMTPVYYCRADVYDEYMAMIDNIIYNTYSYSYMGYDEDDEPFEYRYFLSEDEKLAIDLVLEQTDPIDMPEGASIDYSNYVTVEETNETREFYREKLGIMEGDGYYHIELYSDDYSDSLIYAVPEEFNDIFDSIMECERNSNYEDEYDTEE